MKLFLDTNVFVEFIEHRKQYESVSLIIDAILEEQHTACISTGSLYTLAYLCAQGFTSLSPCALKYRAGHVWPAFFIS